MSNTQTSLFVKMAIMAWQSQNARVDKMIETFSDAQWQREIAPGKNTGIYLLGHLAAVNDNLFPLFGWGDTLHPELEKLFLTSPDKSGQQFPALITLKKYWKEINEKLTAQIQGLSTDEWFARHTAVSEADFSKEPHRNKLNVLLNRTSHQSYHVGQLVLLAKNNEG